MIFYDIHTHLFASDPEEVSVMNIVVRDGYDIPAVSHWQSCGIHPWYIDKNGQNQLLKLCSLALLPQTVAIGEAGLDKLAMTPLVLQKEVFLEQALLAEKVGKPLIIHCVKAWDELIASYKTVKPHFPWIIHGFRGNGILAEQLLRLGFYLSFGMYFNPAALQAAWPDRLFVETDENGMNIRTVYQEISGSLHLSVEDLALALKDNILEVFPVILS